MENLDRMLDELLAQAEKIITENTYVSPALLLMARRVLQLDGYVSKTGKLPRAWQIQRRECVHP